MESSARDTCCCGAYLDKAAATNASLLTQQSHWGFSPAPPDTPYRSPTLFRHEPLVAPTIRGSCSGPRRQR